MSFKNDKSIDLVEELRQTFNVIGYEKTKAAIASARDIGDKFKNQRLTEDFIVRECSAIFRVPQKELLTGKTTGARTDCLMVIFMMIKKHLGFSNAKIAKNRGKSVTIVTRGIGRFNMLKESDKQSNSILSKAKKINETIILFKEELYK